MIYCVEDERNIRELLIYTLETTGFKARGFGNGNELMKALKEEIPELILLESEQFSLLVLIQLFSLDTAISTTMKRLQAV